MLFQGRQLVLLRGIFVRSDDAIIYETSRAAEKTPSSSVQAQEDPKRALESASWLSHRWRKDCYAPRTLDPSVPTMSLSGLNEEEWIKLVASRLKMEPDDFREAPLGSCCCEERVGAIRGRPL
jgi:hypothetical protein